LSESEIRDHQRRSPKLPWSCQPGFRQARRRRALAQSGLQLAASDLVIAASRSLELQDKQRAKIVHRAAW